jgi:hypothetical protein
LIVVLIIIALNGLAFMHVRGDAFCAEWTSK